VDTAVAGIRVTGRLRDAGLAAGIAGTLGAVARRAVAAYPVGGVYATGGDVAAAVVHALGAEGFAVETEVRPLAVAGRLVGGAHGGLPFAAKGGLIGDPLAAVECVEHLRMVSATQRWSA
jgi:D-threonate/D-erythronate kinase